MAIRRPAYLPTRINRYVPGMQYAADVLDSGVTKISFGNTTAAANTTRITSNVTANLSSGNFTLQNTSGVELTDCPWGRILTITASNVSITGYEATILGYDYLGQPMVEVLDPGSGNGTVNGTKAFKWVTSANFTNGTGNNVTLSIGVGTALGLPYKTVKVLAENVNGTVGTVGTLNAPNMTTQNATTTDPRGTYIPNASPNGATLIDITCIADTGVNLSNSTLGGLFGLAHYGG